MGVTDCDNMLMLLGVSNKMSEKERDVVVPMMMRGFKVIIITQGFILKSVMFSPNSLEDEDPELCAHHKWSSF